MKPKNISIMILMLLLVLIPSSVYACSTPVFRYALERWAADYYDAVLLHRGPLSPDEQKLLDKLRQEDVEEAFLNLNVLQADITTSTEEKVKTLLMSEKLPETLPTLVLWYPWHKGRTPPFWQGPLTELTVKAFLQSPVRDKLAECLTSGQTTVWIFIKSGNSAKDKAAFELLEKELETATSELKKEMESIPADMMIGPEIKYEFSILPVSRNDPNESMLLNIFLTSEPDLDEYKDKPIVFPVFGRGRALYALVGEGINTENIRETISFLVGPCGCEIKMMNPGVDMLMAAKWDEAAMKFYEEYSETYDEIPEVTGVMPEAPVDTTAKLQSEDTITVQNVSDSEGQEEPDKVQSAVTEDTQGVVEVKERKILGLGLIGTTGIMLAVIVLVVVLTTVALSPRRKDQL